MEERNTAAHSAAGQAKNEQERKTNEPLKFPGLTKLVPEHQWFKEPGIEPKTIEDFGLGFNTNPRGLTGHRIAIPIHNAQGELVAYCGRAVTHEQEEKAKYKLPTEDKFKKSLEVYNLHRQDESVGQLYIVESYISVWRLCQLGLWNTVALMGASMSEAQEALILERLKPHGLAILIPDADEAGDIWCQDCLKRLGKHINVRWVDLKPFDVKKPHQLSEEQLNQLLFITE